MVVLPCRLGLAICYVTCGKLLPVAMLAFHALVMLDTATDLALKVSIPLALGLTSRAGSSAAAAGEPTSDALHTRGCLRRSQGSRQGAAGGDCAARSVVPRR